MAKLTRYLQKIFANNSNQVGVFGTGTDKETSKNVETLQSADYEEGWSSAVITNKNYPIWQERDGVDYGFSYQLAYLMQAGIPEWLSTETYYTNSYCRYGSDIYYSLQDDNTNHNPALNDGYWQKLSSDKANVSLDNLDSTGQTKFDEKLNVSGGTVTGDLTVQGQLIRQGANNPLITVKDTTYAYTDTPSEGLGVGGFQVVDKNGVWVAIFGTEFLDDGRNLAKMQVKAKNGTSARIQIYSDSNNKFHCTFPMCTTKPTTTSSAAGDLISAVKQNYVNGTSGYIVYTDGLIAQWGKTAASFTTGTISLLKSFSNTNYNVQIIQTSSTADATVVRVSSQTSSNFAVRKDNWNSSLMPANALMWYAIGY